MIETTGMIGRVRELRVANNALVRGQNILVLGNSGIGETAFLSYIRMLAEAYEYLHLTLADNTISVALKQAIEQYQKNYPHEFFIPQELYEKLPKETRARHEKRVRKNSLVGRDGMSYIYDMPWKELSRIMGTSNMEARVDILQYSLQATLEYCLQCPLGQYRRQTVFMERLGIITPSKVSVLDTLFSHCQIVAVLRQEKAHLPHLKQLQNKFPTVIELNPLSGDETEELVSKWIKHRKLPFDSDAAKNAFVQYVVRDSGGVPSNIELMLNQAEAEPKISRSKIREFSNKHVDYRSMLPLDMLFLFSVGAFKTVYRMQGDMPALILGIVAIIILFILFGSKSVLEKTK